MNELEFKIILDLFHINETGSARIGNETIKVFYYYDTLLCYNEFGGVIVEIKSSSLASLLSKKFLRPGLIEHQKIQNEDSHELENLYIDRYFINAKEILILVLLQIQSYYNKISYIRPEQKQKEILTEVYKGLIEYGNPYQFDEVWLKDHDMINSGVSNELLFNIKKFDEVINPFCNSDYEMKDPVEYVDKVNFSLESYPWGQMMMKIYNNMSLAQFRRQSQKCGESLCYMFSFINSGVETSISHNIMANQNLLFLGILDCYDMHILNLGYDLISGKIIGNFTMVEKGITSEQFIMENLEKAILLAQELTLKNMTVPRQKSLKMNSLNRFQP